MSKFNKLGRPFAWIASLVVVLLCAACEVQVDDTLGANLVPDNQQMKAGYIMLEGINPRRYVETRLYQTDSIASANISYGFMGSSLHDKLGSRSASFMTQMTNYYLVDSGYFGYRPIFDSVILQLSIQSYGGDTTSVQEFAVYEIVSNDYIKESEDTLFFLNYDPVAEKVVSEEPLFTFELGGDKGPATTSVTLQPTEAGRAYIDRLFLLDGKYKGDYSIYSRDSVEQWLEEFKGLYIKPTKIQEGKGAIYATTLESSSMAVYGRNRRPEDPSLIKDTIGMVYYFYDSYYMTNENVSINMVDHDYTTGSLGIDIASINEQSTERAESSQLIVEGMGGILSELTFTQELFDAFDKILSDEYAASKQLYSTLAFSRAMIYFYLPSSIYDYLSIGPALGDQYTSLLDEMDTAQARLGLYTNYKKLTPVSDYAYSYEESKGVTLDYDGYINRSHGRYAMNITGYMQQLWNSYRKERDAAKAEGRPINLENVEQRVVYLAPAAYSAYDFDYSFLQGANNDAEAELAAPIRFEFTYNMIR
ncbi:MAG: DUF4270 family protein [Alistipes sp.]|nr:DUF4270 family protein [Alistipes sp.]